MSKVYVDHSPIQGDGVFAATDIQAGEPILAIDDSHLVSPDAILNPEQDEFEHHVDWLAEGKTILMQSPERYINHACTPTSFIKTINGVRWVLALHHIARGQEITYDYCLNSSGDTVWQCHCETPRCRHTIHSDFFHLPLLLQWEYLPLLEPWFLQERRSDVDRLLQKAMAGRDD